MQQRSHHPVRPHNLPRQLTPFVGREEELSEILRLLADPACRLLSLVGPGGIGKTRLAIQAAMAQAEDSPQGAASGSWPGPFPDGVFFVPLQATRSPRHLAPALADALNLSLSGQEEPLVQVFHYLGDKEMLLVLDNFEQLLTEGSHLQDGAGVAAGILQAAPAVKLLATSREALNLREECLYPVGGLPVPPSGPATDLEAYGAVRLFVDSARRVRPDLSLADEAEGVTRICQLVEGMPLALELAASWSRTLSCAEIAGEIECSIDFLSTGLRDVPERHRSMQVVFDGSWEHLGGREQDAFRRLSVFRSGFRRDAALEVAGTTLPVLSTLVDKSLLRSVPDGRYLMHELLRQCAEERLAGSPEDLSRAYNAHCSHYSRFLEQQFNDLLGGRQIEAIARIGAELDNVRAAWQWAVEQGQASEIRRAALPLSLFYQMRGRFVEGQEALAEAARRLSGMEPVEEVELALLALTNDLAWLEIRLGRLEQAGAWAAQSREIYRRLDIPPLRGQGTDPRLSEGVIAAIRGDYAAVARAGEEALEASKAPDHPWNRELACYLLAQAALGQGDYETAREYAWEAYTSAQQIQDRWFMTYCLNELGDVDHALEDYAGARQHYEASFAIREEFDDPEGMAEALNHLGEVALRQGAGEEAQGLYGRSLAIYEETGDRGGQAASLAGLGQAALALGDYERARDRLRRALCIAAEMRFTSLLLSLLTGIGELLLLTGRKERGLELLALALHHPASDQGTRRSAEALLARHRAQAQPGEAADLDRVVATLERELARPLPPSVPGGHLPGGDVLRVPPADQPLVEPLTPRELDVLQLLAGGLSNREIADELVIAVGTVKSYTSQIYGKLAVRNRTQAVARGRELGLLP